ncbi:MAG: substrate-binding domain-containing protein [Methanomassiliicoccales archaeon]
MNKRFKKDREAISPVVATLMLVLVAVASVTGFFVFIDSWQNDQEDQVDDADISYEGESFIIGGSSTVYAFSTIAAEQYMVLNDDVKISVGYTSSGAGLTALKSGAIDIAGYSKALSASETTVTSITIGYDAAVVITSASSTHGLLDISAANLLQIYKCNGGVAGTYALDADDSGSIEWNEVPVSTASATIMCTGTEEVTIYDRSTESGTEEVFAKNMLGLSTVTLEESNIVTGHSMVGNPELIAAVAADANAIGFTSMGEASTANSVDVMKFAGVEAKTSTIKDSSYLGARPLNLLVMTEDYTGAIKDFVDYCLLDSINMQICEQSGFVSIYA